MKSRSPCSDIDAMQNSGAILGGIFLLFIGGCAPDPNRLHNDQVGVRAPLGTRGVSEAVDGLTVGHRLMNAGEYELALRAYSRAALDQGFTVDVLSAIGSANLYLGRLGQSETYLRRAVEVDETFVPAWNNLGVLLATRGEFVEAREVFRLAFALDSGRSLDIRDNLRVVEARLQDIAVPGVTDYKFRLVRRGTGRYLLLGND